MREYLIKNAKNLQLPVLCLKSTVIHLFLETLCEITESESHSVKSNTPKAENIVNKSECMKADKTRLKIRQNTRFGQ